jgi:hypothetical protein
MQKTYREKAQKVFEQSLKNVFELVPNLGCVAWAQYTPYFNDGDACTFRIGDVWFSNATADQMAETSYFEDIEEVDEGLWVDTPWGFRKMENFSEEDSKVLSALSKFVSRNEDLMESMFGDHVRIIVDKDGVHTEEYDHD